MQFAVLGSGSRGNATVIRCGQTLLLVDNGFSGKELERRLANVGLLASELDGILVTHEHSDHIAGHNIDAINTITFYLIVTGCTK